MPRWITGSARALIPRCCSGCGRLGPGAVTAFSWRWFARLPQVLTTAGLRAGYVHELAFRQFEVAGTLVSGRPAAGRAFFEGLIRDHLDAGRPDCVSLTSGRRVSARTPGASRAKVVTQGAGPQISCTTRPAGSGSTSRRTGHCGLRPSSATPAKRTRSSQRVQGGA